MTPDAAKASIQRAAKVELAAQSVPEEAREQGLAASYSNAPTVAKDRQVVALFMLKDAGVASKVKEMVRGSVPQRSRLIVNDNVLVVYAASGADHGAAVEQAVKAL